VLTLVNNQVTTFLKLSEHERSRLSPRVATHWLAGAALVVIASMGVTETDIWGHLRFGLDILRTHRLPLVDPYSFTSDQQWINHEWLSQAVFAAAFSIGGLVLLACVRAAVAAGLVVLLHRGLAQTTLFVREVAVIGALLSAVPLLRTVRPQIFSLPFYALTLYGISRDALWLPLLFVLWANLHGGWLIGLGAVAANTALAPTPRRILTLTLCAVATLANPYGLSLWWALLEASVRGWSEVVEWQSVVSRSWISDVAITWGLIAVGCAWASARAWKRITWFGVLWTGCVAIAAFRASRLVPFFATTAAMLPAAQVRRTAGQEEGKSWTPELAIAMSGCAIGLLAGAWTLLTPTLTCLPRVQPPLTPDPGSVAFIREHGLRGRVLTYFDWGLYGVWHVGDQLKVSIDNRRETVYSDQLVRDHHRFYDGKDPEYPDRINADYVWLPPDAPAVDQLRRRGWFVAYEGTRSTLLSRAYQPATIDRAVATRSCFPDP
jgi:hypothetical protein